nr:uncharacterized protein LOC129266917 [Lytechinus pictus]
MTRLDRARVREEREVLAAMDALDVANLRGVSPEEEARLRGVIADYMTRRTNKTDNDSEAEFSDDDVVCDHLIEDKEEEEVRLDEEAEPEDLPLLDIDPLAGPVIAPDTTVADAEQERRMLRDWNKCTCKRHCKQLFPADDILNYRLDIFGLSREQKDLVIMAQIAATQDCSASTKSTRKKQKERQAARNQYLFHGSAICRDMFMLLHSISSCKLNSLKTWLWRTD